MIERIDDLVDKKALEQLEALITGINGADKAMEEILKMATLIASEFSKVGNSAASLVAVIEKQEKAEREYNKIVQEKAKLLQEVNKVTQEVIHSGEEQAKETEKQEKATKKLELTTQQLLNVSKKMAEGIDISASIKKNEGGMKDYSTAINVLNQQIGQIGGIQEALNEKFKEGAISEEQYNSAMSALSQKQAEYEQTLTSLKDNYEQTGEAQRKIFDISGEAFSQLSPRVQELTVSLVEENQMLNEIRSAQKELDNEYKNGNITLEQYAQKKAELKSLETEQAIAVKDLAKELQLNKQITETAAGSYDNLSARYSLMKIEINALGEAEGQNAEQKRKLEQEAKSLYEQMNNLQKATGKAQLQVGDYTMINRELEGALNTVNPALGGTIRGIQGATKAALAFIATPLGIVLAAIAAALALVSSWFTRTEEGQNALAVATSAFTQVLNGVLDIADNVGEWLFKAFTSPKEAVKELGDFITSQVTNRLSALAKAGEAIQKIFSGDFAEGFKGLGEAALQGVTGVEDMAGKMGEYADKVKRAAEIQNELNKIEIKQRELGVEKSKTMSEQNRLRNIANNQENSLAERQAANNEYVKLTNELEEKEIGLLKQQFELETEKVSLSHTSKQEKQKLADLEKKIYDTEAASEQRLFTATRLNNRLHREATNEQKKATEEQNKKLRELGEIEAFNYKKSAEIQKAIYEDADSSLEDRKDALEQYIKYEIDAITEKEEIEVLQAGLSTEQIKLIHAKADYEREKLAGTLNKNLDKLQKEQIDNLIEANQKKIGEIEAQETEAMQAALLLADEEYLQKTKANLSNADERKKIERDYQAERLRIIREYNQKIFEQEIALLNESINSTELSEDKKEEIRAEIRKMTMKNAKEIADYEMKMTQDKIDNMMTAEQKFQEFMNDSRTKAVMGIWEQALDIANSYYDNELKRIDELEAREKEYYDEKIKLIDENLEAGTISEEEADARKRILEETQLQREKEFDRQRKEMQKKQAVWQKAEAMVQATINTAVAVVSALGSQPFGLWNIALAAVIGALGAAQISMIASQPIPSYKEGTKGHPGGPAIVGDGGRPEMAILPSGEIWKTPARDTLVNLPAGTEILPDFKKAWENVASRPVMIYKTDEGKGQTVVLQQDEILRKNTKEMIGGIYSLQKGVNAIRANSMYSNQRKYINNILSKY